MLGVSLQVPGVPPQGAGARYSPWVSHSNGVPPHREVTDQSFRRRLLPFIAVQVHRSVSLGRQNIQVLKYNVRIKQEASTRARERPCRGQRVYLTHLHDLVFRVDELDLWHVDAHGIACLFCLLSREIEIRRDKAHTSYSPSTATAGLTPEHALGSREVALGQGQSVYSQFSSGCLISPPAFCSGRVSISPASLLTQPRLQQTLIS